MQEIEQVEFSGKIIRSFIDELLNDNNQYMMITSPFHERNGSIGIVNTKKLSIYLTFKSTHHKRIVDKLKIKPLCGEYKINFEDLSNPDVKELYDISDGVTLGHMKIYYDKKSHNGVSGHQIKWLKGYKGPTKLNKNKSYKLDLFGQEITEYSVVLFYYFEKSSIVLSQVVEVDDKSIKINILGTDTIVKVCSPFDTRIVVINGVEEKAAVKRLSI